MIILIPLLIMIIKRKLDVYYTGKVLETEHWIHRKCWNNTLLQQVDKENCLYITQERYWKLNTGCIGSAGRILYSSRSSVAF